MKIGEAYLEITVKDDKMDVQLKSTQQKVTSAVVGIQGKLDAVNTKKMQREVSKASEEVGNLTRAFERANRTLIAFFAVAAIQQLISGFNQLVDMGKEYNKQIETSTVGIASILASQGAFINSQGKVLDGQGRINAALGMSSSLVKQLEKDNLRTIATMEQLVTAFQQTLAPGLSSGFNVEQVRQFTVAMVQAAGALGLNLNMMAEETRSLLKGTINPRTSFIATALNIDNEDIRKHKGNANDLFNFIMGKLEAFEKFGIEASKTYSGLFSNVKDAFGKAMGQATQPFFEYLKSTFARLYDYMVKIDPLTGEININPEFIENLKVVNSLLVNTVKIMEGLGEFLNKIVLPGLRAIQDFANRPPALVGNEAAFGYQPPTVASTDIGGMQAEAQRYMQKIIEMRNLIDNTRYAKGNPFVFLDEIQINILIKGLEALSRSLRAAGKDTSDIDSFLKELKDTSLDFHNSIQAASESTIDYSTAAITASQETENLIEKIKKLTTATNEFNRAEQRISNSLTLGIESAQIRARVAESKRPRSEAQAWIEYERKMLEIEKFVQDMKNSGMDPREINQYSEDMAERNDQLLRENLRALGAEEKYKDELRQEKKQPLTFQDIDQQMDKFSDKTKTMYRELAQADYDYRASIAQYSGQYYEAEMIRIEAWKKQQEDSMKNQVSQAERAYRELEQRVQKAEGKGINVDANIYSQLDQLKEEWEQTKKVAEEFGLVVDKQVNQKIIEAGKISLDTAVNVAELRKRIADLVGDTQSRLLYEQKLLEAQQKADIFGKSPEEQRLIIRASDIQEQRMELERTGTALQGLQYGFAELGRTMETQFQAGAGFAKTFADSFTEAFSSLISGSESASKAISKMLQSIAADILRYQVYKLLGSIFSFAIPSLSASVGTASLGGTGGSYYAQNPALPGRAGGGSVMPGSDYLVGEEGPEILRMGKRGGGYVQPLGKQQPKVTVNVKNETGQPIAAENVGLSIDSENFIADVVLKKMSTDRRFRNQMAQLR